MKTALAFVLISILAVGCNPAEKTSADTKSGETPVAEGKPKPPSPSEIPSELKHSGFEYYGLAMDKPMMLQFIQPSGAIQTGEQTSILKELKDGTAIYEIQRTGGIGAQMGNNEIRLEKDGIYVHSSSIAKVGDRDLEMPADVSPGKTWTTKTKIEQPTNSMEVTMNFKSEGIEKVKTPAGEYDALLVTGNGKGTINGQNVRMETRGWYVKGRGNVRTEMTTIDSKGARQSLRIEETKPTSG
jgi:hypothetical protein